MKKVQQEKWESLDETGSIIERVTQMFGARSPRIPQRATPQPPFEISEFEDGYLVRADYPGVKKDDVNIVFEDAILTIEANRRREDSRNSQSSHCSEFAYGLSVRRFRIPDDADSSSAEASLEDGVLTLSVGKSDIHKAESRSISVSTVGSTTQIREDRSA